MRIHDILVEKTMIDGQSKDLDQYVTWLINHLKGGGRFDRVMLDHPNDLSMYADNYAVLSPLIAQHLKDKFGLKPTKDDFTPDALAQLYAAKDHSNVFRLIHPL